MMPSLSLLFLTRDPCQVCLKKYPFVFKFYYFFNFIKLNNINFGKFGKYRSILVRIITTVVSALKDFFNGFHRRNSRHTIKLKYVKNLITKLKNII